MLFNVAIYMLPFMSLAFEYHLDNQELIDVVQSIVDIEAPRIIYFIENQQT